MKATKHLTIIGLAIIVALTSCSIEKRVFMSGYHIEWNKKSHNFDNQEILISDNAKQKAHNQIELIEQAERENVSVLNSVIERKKDYSISPTAEKEAVSIFVHSAFPLETKTNKMSEALNFISFSKNKISNEKVVENKLKEFKAKNSSSDEEGSGALRAIGWIVVILGFLILLLASIFLGALLMLLGLIFVIGGRKKDGASSQSNTKNENTEYVDVVYLKNGSVIRGMVIEQTPNLSLKIQTKDGSIFVYKMEEVEKITKELSE